MDSSLSTPPADRYGRVTRSSEQGKAQTNGSRSFTLPQLAALSGIDYRTLHNWVGRGLLVASEEQANGSGTTNLFSPTDAFQACVLGDLRRSGIELETLERTAADLRRVGEPAMGSPYLVITSDVQLIDNPADVAAHISSTGPALIYRTHRVRQLVGDAVAKGSE